MEWRLPPPDDVSRWESELAGEHPDVIQLGGRGNLMVEYLRRHPRSTTHVFTLNRGVQFSLRDSGVHAHYISAPANVLAVPVQPSSRLFVVEDYAFAREFVTFATRFELARPLAPPQPRLQPKTKTTKKKKRARPGCEVPVVSSALRRDVKRYIRLVLDRVADYPVHAIQRDSYFVMLGLRSEMVIAIMRKVFVKTRLRTVHVLECDADVRAAVRRGAPADMVVLTPDIVTYRDAPAALELTTADRVAINLEAFADDAELRSHVRSLLQSARRRALSLATFNERADNAFLRGVPAVVTQGNLWLRYMDEHVAEPLRVEGLPEFADVQRAVDLLLPRYELALSPDFPHFTRRLLGALRTPTAFSQSALASVTSSAAIVALLRCDQNFFHRIFSGHPMLVVPPPGIASAARWARSVRASGLAPVELSRNPANLELRPTAAARPLRERMIFSTLGMVLSAPTEGAAPMHPLHVMMAAMFQILRAQPQTLVDAGIPASLEAYVSPFYSTHLRWFPPNTTALHAFAMDIDWDDTTQEVVRRHAGSLAKTTLQLVQALPPLQ